MLKLKKYDNFINEEIDFNLINCQFDRNFIDNFGISINCFTFITNRDNSYTVYIHNTVESNHLLESGILLQSINNNKQIPTIYFSETSRGLDPRYFNLLTNKSEFMEVMGKVIYIINEFINNNKQYDVFSVGGIDDKRFEFYKNWMRNLSISRIEMGFSDNYDKNNKTYYLIR